MISCLGGADTAIVDGSDQLLPDRGGCETVHGDPPIVIVETFELARAPVARVASRIKLAKLLRSGLVVTIDCGAPCTFAARLFADTMPTARLRRIGGRRGSLPAAGTTMLRVTLTPKGKRALRRVHRATLTLRAKVTQSGSVTRATTKVKVRGSA